MIEFRSTNGRAAITGFALALLLAWVCYKPAIGGAFQFDDLSNLAGLQYVSDFDSGMDFALSGHAGPLGRPVALATFAAQADRWDQGAGAFLRVNILIHLLNAVLLACFVLQLALCKSALRPRAMAIAALAASAWVLMPLLAPASLSVVQRMTTLSAMFVLAGLVAYLAARARIERHPRPALIGMSSSIVIATTLAMLSKESGLLLPVFVLVLEVTVLARPATIVKKHWRTWQAIFLALPLAIIVLFLVQRSFYPESMVVLRGFSAGERLMTEARLLWVYVAKAMLGVPHLLGVYQEPPGVARSLLQPATLIAVLSWLALATSAVVWRRRFPLAALAVLWFLAGHLIESTVVPLELYFEHRNYLAVIGPLFAVCAVLVLARPNVRYTGIAALLVVVLVNAWFLYVFASLWGEPSTASRYWAMRYPNSVRAVSTMASYQLDEEGPLRTIATIDAFAGRNPQHAYLRLQALNLLCRIDATADHSALLRHLQQELPSVDFTYTAGTMLSELFSASVASNCRTVPPASVVKLAQALHSNPRYAFDPVYNQFHEKLLAGIARFQGDDAATIRHLRAAISYQASTELNMMMVTALADASDFDAARNFIDDARAGAPANPLHAIQWRRELDQLSAYLDELEKVSQ